MSFLLLFDSLCSKEEKCEEGSKRKIEKERKTRIKKIKKEREKSKRIEEREVKCDEQIFRERKGD